MVMEMKDQLSNYLVNEKIYHLLNLWIRLSPELTAKSKQESQAFVQSEHQLEMFYLSKSPFCNNFNTPT